MEKERGVLLALGVFVKIAEIFPPVERAAIEMFSVRGEISQVGTVQFESALLAP